MPTYDYICDACGHRFEKFQSITAAPIRKCPACRKSKVRRLIGTGAGLIFKGSGFYITDYRSDSYKSGEKAASSSSNGAATSTGTDGGGGESKSGTATEAKPAAKVESPSPAKSSKPAKAAAKT